MGRLVLWALGGLVLGVLLGGLGGLLRKRAVPEVVRYVPPTPAQGSTAVGPHRAVLRA